MSSSTTSLIILAITIALFVWNRLPVGVVAILTSLSLFATGLVDSSTALSGFGDPVVVFIASLFVVSEAVDATGVTAWAGQKLIEVVGDGATRLLVAVMGLCAVLTALITLNGSVAALLPMVVVLAMRIGQPSSRMLMPMVFAGSAGGLLMLTGSPINVIISEAAQDTGAGSFSFFEFALVGVPLVVVTMLVFGGTEAAGGRSTLSTASCVALSRAVVSLTGSLSSLVNVTQPTPSPRVARACAHHAISVVFPAPALPVTRVTLPWSPRNRRPGATGAGSDSRAREWSFNWGTCPFGDEMASRPKGEGSEEAVFNRDLHLAPWPSGTSDSLCNRV